MRRLTGSGLCSHSPMCLFNFHFQPSAPRTSSTQSVKNLTWFLPSVPSFTPTTWTWFLLRWFLGWSIFLLRNLLFFFYLVASSDVIISLTASSVSLTGFSACITLISTLSKVALTPLMEDFSCAEFKSVFSCLTHKFPWAQWEAPPWTENAQIHTLLNSHWPQPCLSRFS